MLDFIPDWECLTSSKSIKNGKPSQYVMFATSGYIRAVFDVGCFTATATIGQRDPSGRLFQGWTQQHPHFVPRKFTITAGHAVAQIRSLNQLVEELNNGSIDPEHIPGKVNSVSKWAVLLKLLEGSK